MSSLAHPLVRAGVLTEKQLGAATTLSIAIAGRTRRVCATFSVVEEHVGGYPVPVPRRVLVIWGARHTHAEIARRLGAGQNDGAFWLGGKAESSELGPRIWERAEAATRAAPILAAPVMSTRPGYPALAA